MTYGQPNPYFLDIFLYFLLSPGKMVIEARMIGK